MATRTAGSAAINAAADVLPEIIQGAADLSVSTNTTITDSGDIVAGEFSGRNIRYGVREHSMGAITNALAAYGGLRPACSTFLTFSDYQKNTIRLAALMNLPSIFVFTHDSIALGEDGPTHQPVEHLAALRAIPNVVTLRPADANETTAAWRVALQRTTGPTALVLTRQRLPMLEPGAPVDRGAYVVADGGDATIVATGSEVHVGLAARETLADEGIAARVVSMPSWELFSAQDQAYREQVIPTGVPRVAVEAASPLGWEKWVGDGPIVAVDRFGASAPGDVVMEALGITRTAVADAVRGSL
jgi:transketolase